MANISSICSSLHNDQSIDRSIIHFEISVENSEKPKKVYVAAVAPNKFLLGRCDALCVYAVDILHTRRECAMFFISNKSDDLQLNDLQCIRGVM